MWKIIQMALPWVIMLIAVSQVILPLMFDTQLFWLFRKKPAKNVEKTGSLKSQVEETKEIVNKAKIQVKEVQEKVDKNFKKAEKLKSESDNLI